ncbi:MAG: DUF6894 family protein [Devosia sp.]
MPRYFFHLTSDTDGKARDEIGIELNGLAAARSEAVRALSEMARDAARGPLPQIEVVVTDHSDALLFALSLRFTLEDYAATTPSIRE